MSSADQGRSPASRAATARRGDDRRVYHLSPARLCLLPLVWIAVVGPLLMLATSGGPPTDEDAAFAIAAAVATAVLLPFQALVWRSLLVLTPEGITHHQFGYTIRSTWDNLQALSMAPGAQALLLVRPGTHSRLLRWSTRLAGAMVPWHSDALFGDADRLAEGRLILLAPFIAHWRRGPLRADLLRWAPHLFDANGQPSAGGGVGGRP